MWVSIVIIFILSVCALSFSIQSKSGKFGYVDLAKVYDDFIYKKEMEKKYMQTAEARKKVIDSLEYELRVLSKDINSEKGKDKSKITTFEIKREAFFKKKKQIDEDNANQQKEFQEKVITQLNQYVKDFSKEQKYNYVFGTDGNGHLMYADETDNITIEVVKYINEKYKGEL